MYKAVKKGKIIRPSTCEICKTKGTVQGHHEDYKQPLNVQWLCGLCHRAADGKRKSRNGDNNRMKPLADNVTRFELRIPLDLLESIDANGGKHNRSAWIREAIEEKLNENVLVSALEEALPVLEYHAEIVAGGSTPQLEQARQALKLSVK